MAVLERVRQCVGTQQGSLHKLKRGPCHWKLAQDRGSGRGGQMGEQVPDQAWTVRPGESLLFILRIMEKPLKGWFVCLFWWGSFSIEGF